MGKVGNFYAALYKHKWVVAPILLLCIAVMLALSTMSYARYRTQFKNSNSINIAIMASDVVYDCSLEELSAYPGFELIVPIELVNRKNGKVSQVRQSFSVEVETLSNLPLTIKLLDNNGNEVSPSGIFEANIYQNYSFNLYISWDESENDYILSDELEIVRIVVHSSQIGGE